MTNVEKLTQLGIIGEVRLRFNADDENDTSRDAQINLQSNSDLIGAYCGWHLGCEEWWTQMKAYYDGLERLSQ